MLSDEALHERLLQGDLAAFDTLYARHARPLHGFIRRHLSDAHEAEDVLHDAFLALLRDPSATRAVVGLRPWLYQVARNLCLNRLRSRRRGARALESAPEPSGPEEPGRALDARETGERLRDAVAKLPEAQAQLYTLRAQGLSYEELAGILGVPLGTVKSRVHDLVTRLRKELER
jgi:RNA polymerase sigma-70 factor (ECF subfamily)